jgi:hypothetical protein
MTEDYASWTGGARIGWVNASWPFATLSARQDQLVLSGSLLGKYTFAPEQVIAIETYTLIPVLGWGLRIYHNIPTYPKKIIFWYLGSPDSLIRQIQAAGFIAKASSESIPVDRGIPVRWQSVVTIVLLLNGLFLLDMHRAGRFPHLPEVFTLVALLLVFFGSMALWWSPLLQHVIMKPDRSCGEIRAWLYLLTLVSGLMSIFVVCFMLAGRMLLRT